MASFKGKTECLTLCHFHDSRLSSFPTLCSRSRSISGGFCLPLVLPCVELSCSLDIMGPILGRVGQCDPASSWVRSVGISHRQVGTANCNQSHPERERESASVGGSHCPCLLSVAVANTVTESNLKGKHLSPIILPGSSLSLRETRRETY